MGNNYNDEYDYSSNYEYSNSDVELTQNDMAQIDNLLRSGKKVDAIRLVQTKKNIGLVEAKTWIESYCSKTRNDSLVCPDCGSTSFDNENGVYYCQICGCQLDEKIGGQPSATSSVKTTSDTTKKPVATILQLIIYCCLALLELVSIFRSIPVLSHLPSIYVITWFFDLFCCFSLIGLALLAVSDLKGWETKNALKKACLGIYTFLTLCVFAIFSIGSNMLLNNLIRVVFNIAFLWVVALAFPKWIKK